MNDTIRDILFELDHPQHIDVDRLRTRLCELVEYCDQLDHKLRLYELQLQRELRAKVDLCGGIPACPDPESAFRLTGNQLLSARAEMARRFNEVFYMAPLCRNARKPALTGAAVSAPPGPPSPSADRTRAPSALDGYAPPRGAPS